MRRAPVALLLLALGLLPGCFASVVEVPWSVATWTVGAAVDVTTASVEAVVDVVGGDEDAASPGDGAVVVPWTPPACAT